MTQSQGLLRYLAPPQKLQVISCLGTTIPSEYRCRESISYKKQAMEDVGINRFTNLEALKLFQTVEF